MLLPKGCLRKYLGELNSARAFDRYFHRSGISGGSKILVWLPLGSVSGNSAYNKDFICEEECYALEKRFISGFSGRHKVPLSGAIAPGSGLGVGA